MTVDYIVSSLPPLVYGEKPPMDPAAFFALCGEHAARVKEALANGAWNDIETQIRNASASARGAEDASRPAEGCDIALRERVAAAFRESGPLERQKALDRIEWDAAGGLAEASSPLGFGALVAYAARLGIAEKAARFSCEDGSAAFGRLVASAKEEK